MGIRHILIIESQEYGSVNYIGLFIGKSKNEKLINEKQITNTYNTGLGSLYLNVSIPKQTFYMNEEIPVKIESNINALFKKVDKIENELYRKIEWIGYMKNSLLEKKQISCAPSKYNEDKFGMAVKITFLFSFLKIVGQLFSDYNFFDFFSELSKQKYNINNLKTQLFSDKNITKFKKLKSDERIGELTKKIGNPIGKEIIKMAEKTSFEESKIISSKIYKSMIFDKNKEKLKSAKKNLAKFINFKGKKIIGFETFISDITPPLNGYYFKCNYQLKINVHLTGMILDQDKNAKIEIDFYDGEKYIQDMKKLLNTENIN